MTGTEKNKTMRNLIDDGENALGFDLPKRDHLVPEGMNKSKEPKNAHNTNNISTYMLYILRI